MRRALCALRLAREDYFCYSLVSNPLYVLWLGRFEVLETQLPRSLVGQRPRSTFSSVAAIVCCANLSHIAAIMPTLMWSNSKSCYSTTTTRHHDLNVSRLGRMLVSSAWEVRSSKRCSALVPKGDTRPLLQHLLLLLFPRGSQCVMLPL